MTGVTFSYEARRKEKDENIPKFLKYELERKLLRMPLDEGIIEGNNKQISNKRAGYSYIRFCNKSNWT